ncbi:hypothetical protein FRC08_001311 [Ceratobasidium sp. 394]|nr:hypothetical protein FRC08_001311 [Ceratobasidium sp. 394]
MEVVSQWMVAQSNLKQAASAFLDACAALKALALQPLEPSHNQQMLGSAIDEINPYINDIELVQDQLRESRAALNALRNRSTIRVPINRLPPELLGHIFAIVVDHKGSTSKSAPLANIRRVCARWDRVCVNSPQFWSHIDADFTIVPDTSAAFDRIRLWLTRSRRTPIHLRFVGTSEIPQNAISELVSILQSRLTDLNSLAISGTCAPALFQALFDPHSTLEAPVPLKSLTLTDTRVTHREHAISWPIPSLSRLVELTLAELRDFASPTFGQIVSLLSSCPTLHTLRLRSPHIRASPEQEYPVISLPCLRLLEIQVFGEYHSLHLLPLLSPGVHELDVKLRLSTFDFDGWNSQLQAFLARSNVVHLTLNPAIPDDTANSLLLSTPCLRVLVLHITLPYGLTKFEQMLSLNNHSIPLLPRLQYLCLASATMESEDMEELERVVAGRTLHSLVLWSCVFSHSETRANNRRYKHLSQEPSQIALERLLARVKRLVIAPLPPDRVRHGVDLSIQELVTHE